MPVISPIAQPVRQWRVAEIAVRQDSVMRRTIYPLGVYGKGLAASARARSH